MKDVYLDERCVEASTLRGIAACRVCGQFHAVAAILRGADGELAAPHGVKM